MGLVGFALKCFDALAWPVLALGYPTYASVLAIEANSSADALKLVTYWVFFSLISLVEHALGTLLFWLPFWPYIKLAFVTWLMIPHFDGAFYVYEHLVRPCFSITTPVIIDGMNKRKELSLKGEDLLVEEEKYLHQNGPEALEELLSSQSMCKIQMAAPKSIVAAEVKEKEVVAVEESSYNESTVAELKDRSEMITAEAKVGNVNNQLPILPTPPSVQALGQVPLQESQREWTCALCQVTAKTEYVLQSHLQGKRHKAALESLKAKKRPLFFNDAQKAVLKALKATNQQLHPKDIQKATLELLKAYKQQLLSKQNAQNCVSGNVTGQPATLWCSICDVTCSGSGNFVQHHNGKKHLARIQELAGLNSGCKEAGETGI